MWKKKCPTLFHLDFELTERCNNNCIHCYNNLPIGNSQAKNKELSTAKIKKILEEAASLGCLRVRFTGGEPLLRADFDDIYIFTRKLGMRVFIFTNAILLSPQRVKMLSQIPPLEKVEVSIYGMKRQSYESVTRVPGSFDAAWKGIDLLAKHKIPFIAKSAILPPNKSEMKDFESWAKSVAGMKKKPSYTMLYDLRCRRDSEDKNSQLVKLRLSPDEALDILAADSENYITEMLEFCSKFSRPHGDILFSCGAGLNSGCVDAYGLLKPCIPLSYPGTTYNLNTGTLKDALEKYFPAIRTMKSSNPDYLDRCARCFLKGLCDQCPAKSWMENGTLDSPVEYFCESAHRQAQFLGLLKQGERAWEIVDWEKRVLALSLNHSRKREKNKDKKSYEEEKRRLYG